MNLSGPFIKRPVATMLLSLAIMLLGGVSFGLLPVSPLPQMDFPVIVVQASLPGASPEVMASTVATPLERSFGAIAGVNTMSSRSSQGSTRVILQFDLDRDINGAAREVQAAINASRNLLPSGMRSMPTYKKVNPSQAPIMVLTPAMAPKERSSGVATVEAMTSGLAPGRLAWTTITGKSICGSGATGNRPKLTPPSSMIARLSNIVATGRLMKGPDRFMAVLPVPRTRTYGPSAARGGRSTSR